MTKTNTNVYQKLALSKEEREQRRGKQVYKNKTYQNGALTHHLRDALSQLCGHARLIQATREFAFHSRISFAFTVVAVPIVDVDVVVVVLFTTMQGLNDAWGTSCCYCCCFLSLCLCAKTGNKRTHTNLQAGCADCAASSAALLCLRMTNSFILPRGCCPHESTFKGHCEILFVIHKSGPHTHTRTQHARTPTTNVYGTLIE